MTNRLTRIYTRSGDQGSTGLANGERISKTSLRIDTLGTIDELNSSIGLIIASLGNNPMDQDNTADVCACLTLIQHQLFDLGGELAVADENYTVIDQSEINYLEQEIDRLNQQLPPLKEFILPGGPLAACHTHLARSICRRAERCMTALVAENTSYVSPLALAYLNRLSDLLFVASRTLALRQGGEEVLWCPRDKR